MNSAILPNSPPTVSIIIPARNEEANIERCLRSLVLQKGIPFEILIVDDASTDRTRAIAESFTHARECPFLALNRDLIDVRVLDAPEPLPEGWTGKANALVAGEKAARGEWLLFTDADTEHIEGSLAAAVAEAEQHKTAERGPEQRTPAESLLCRQQRMVDHRRHRHRIGLRCDPDRTAGEAAGLLVGIHHHDLGVIEPERRRPSAV